MSETLDIESMLWTLLRRAGRPRTVSEFQEMLERTHRITSSVEVLQSWLTQWHDAGYIHTGREDMYQISARGLRQEDPPVLAVVRT